MQQTFTRELNGQTVTVSVTHCGNGYFVAWRVRGRLTETELVKRRLDLVIAHVNRRLANLARRGETYSDFADIFRRMDALDKELAG